MYTTPFFGGGRLADYGDMSESDRADDGNGCDIDGRGEMGAPALGGDELHREPELSKHAERGERGVASELQRYHACLET